MTAAISLRGVAWRADEHFEIRDLSMTVPEGAIYGFLGANGAGKTTTIRMIVGLTRPDAGSVTVVGHDVTGEPSPALARTGYVPERPHLYGHLSVDEHMAFHAAFHRRWDADFARQLKRGFTLIGERKVRTLSKGETGKLMILLALAQRPDLLVLDEPTDGLDPVVRRDVLGAVLDYVANEGASVLISSHLVHELERMCDWVGVLDHGHLVAEMPMLTFKNGTKRLRVDAPPALVPESPFAIIHRTAAEGRTETWLVRGWQPPMAQFFEGIGARLLDVVDLDLEEGFVEMLRANRRRDEASTGEGR